MMYRTGIVGLSRSTSFNPLMSAVLILICASGIFSSISNSLFLLEGGVVVPIWGCA